MHQILSGIRVLELGQLIAGPFAAKTLADFGAEIIKVESPQDGDPLRKWRMIHEGTSVWWQAQSRNKQSICIDLRLKEGQDIVRRLAKEADVLIENYKVGGLKKYGLDYDSLSRINPRLIYCSITGFGQDGPYADRPVATRDPAHIKREAGPNFPHVAVQTNWQRHRQSAGGQSCNISCSVCLSHISALRFWPLASQGASPLMRIEKVERNGGQRTRPLMSDTCLRHCQNILGSQ